VDVVGKGNKRTMVNSASTQLFTYKISRTSWKMCSHHRTVGINSTAAVVFQTLMIIKFK
jgi:ribosomal protein S10